jgi:hypothetical protein
LSPACNLRKTGALITPGYAQGAEPWMHEPAAQRPYYLSAINAGKASMPKPTVNRASTIALGDNAQPYGYPLNRGVLRR